MAIKEFSFKVDFITKNSLCMAHVKQNDNAIFNIYLTEQGQALDLTGQQIRLFVRKPDGKLVVQEEAIEVVDAKGGAIKVNVQNSIFQAVGVAVCEIDLWGSDKNNASSGSFLINIDEQLGSNDAVESYVDVNLFRQLTEYIDEANAEILKYKTLFEGFVKAGVSLEGLNDIKAYIDNNLADLKAQGDRAVDLIPKINQASTDAEAKRVEVVNATTTAESKRAEVVDTTNQAEAKRIEVVNVTATAEASKNSLITASTNADNKKKELETATANAEAKRTEVVAVTNTANTSKAQLETATANADAKKKEVETATSTAEAKRVDVVNATNTANTTKTALDSSITSGNSVKAGLDASISTGNSLKAGLDADIKSGNDLKTALESVTSSADTKKAEVETATANAEAKRTEVVAVTDSAEAKRKELQDMIDGVGTTGFVKKSGDTLEGSLDFRSAGTGIQWHYDGDGAGIEFVSTGNADPDTHLFFYTLDDGNEYFKFGHKHWNNPEPPEEWASITGDGIFCKGQKVYHQGYKPTPQDIGAMGLTFSGGYYGMVTPLNGGSEDWVRTTNLGLIPYQQGVNSALGTQSWQFADGWIDHIHAGQIEATRESTFTDGNGYNDPLVGTTCAIKASGKVVTNASYVVSGNGKTLTIGTGENDCYFYNSVGNKYFQLKDDGRVCINDSEVPYGYNVLDYNNGTGEMTEGRLHLGGNMYLFWGWFNVNLPDAGAVSRDYTVPSCKRIHSVSVCCYSKNAEYTYGELGVLSIWSTGFKTRLYNSRSGGQHCIAYQVIGTI